LERRQDAIVPFVPLVIGIDMEDLAGGLGGLEVVAERRDAEENHQ
jgi:hypothetical protein